MEKLTKLRVFFSFFFKVKWQNFSKTNKERRETTQRNKLVQERRDITTEPQK